MLEGTFSRSEIVQLDYKFKESLALGNPLPF